MSRTRSPGSPDVLGAVLPPGGKTGIEGFLRGREGARLNSPQKAL